NIQAQAIQNLLESSSSSQVEMFIVKANRNRRDAFKKEIWAYYLSQCKETNNFISKYESHKIEIERLEAQAAGEAPQWLDAIKLFNSRFVDMPFKLDLYNKQDVVLGRDKAVLKFIFEEGQDVAECKRSEIKALSQGEKRALYLLNFIFDVENRKRNSKETIFIIDDIADSFDYKNKHAILQYLEDLTRTDFFYQIVLTHNFDFFRSLANNFVHRQRCLMANKVNDSIELVKADAVNDIFLNLWKGKVHEDDVILYSCVPFSRNIIEYIKGTDSADYLLLTKLLHWKEDTKDITKGQFFNVYNNVFGTAHDIHADEKLYDILMSKAEEISSSDEIKGLDLQDKIILSIAIRILGEKYITEQLRIHKKDTNYWSDQGLFGRMLNELEKYLPPTDDKIVSLRKVSVTVSSNIHLNSFMYEPILDLSLVHLVALYKEIKAL
ncbi:AAA family ATPase, partial [Vibrio cholerae]|nr:AAA family ATPase [Vibrio cholerae]